MKLISQWIFHLNQVVSSWTYKNTKLHFDLVKELGLGIAILQTYMSKISFTRVCIAKFFLTTVNLQIYQLL